MSESSSKRNLSQIIFVLGPPGAGKTYLCKKLAQESSADAAVHVVMSDLLREEAQRPDSPWALEVSQKLPTGVLMSGELTTAVLKRYIHGLSPTESRLHLLDGFPRSLEQAKDFDLKIGRAQKTISLKCSENVMEERRAARGRDDDVQKVAESRYQSYLDETVPAIDFLRCYVHKVIEVSSDQSGDEGFRTFMQAI